MTKIKICGLTNLRDARLASELGADAVGFVFAESPRKVSPEVVQKMIESLPPFITKVGVFADERADIVKRIYHFCGLNVVQLHGNESEAYVSSLPLPLIRTYRVRDDTVLDRIRNDKPAYFLLETYDETSLGGTGKRFDWDIGARAARLGNVILAGGLRASNVREALETAGPYGVDVSSGVEGRPGKKDPAKLREFIQEVREWDSRTN
jgi:phosphoribosylanthranilate isomerase